MGTSPPARDSTPAPRPKLGVHSYNSQSQRLHYAQIQTKKSATRNFLGGSLAINYSCVYKHLHLDNTLMTATIALNWGLGILLGVMTLLFIFRIVLTWTPQIDLTQMPFKLVAVPTEPLLAPLRKVVPPIGGVDMTPVIWVGIFSLLRELLLGQQGILTIVTMR